MVDGGYPKVVSFTGGVGKVEGVSGKVGDSRKAQGPSGVAAGAAGFLEGGCIHRKSSLVVHREVG